MWSVGWNFLGNYLNFSIFFIQFQLIFIKSEFNLMKIEQKNRTIWTRKTEKFETKTQNRSRHNEISKMMHMFNKYWSINCKKQLNELESIDFDFRYCHLWIKYSILSHLYLKMLQKMTKTNSKLVELVYRYLLELNKLIKLVCQFK